MMIRFVLCMCLLGFTMPSFAQTWQEYHDKSLTYWEKDWKLCAEYLEKSLPLVKEDAKKNPEKNNNYFIILAELGTSKRKLLLYNDAEKIFKTAKTLALETFGEESTQHASSCSHLGLLYLDLGKIPLAESFLKTSLRIYTKIEPNTSKHARVCYNLGDLYEDNGQYALAESLLKISATIRLQFSGKESHDYVVDCNRLAILYEHMGRFARAESLFKEAMQVRILISGKNSSGYATNCNNLGMLYKNMGQYRLAEERYLEAKTIYAQVSGKNGTDYGLSCGNLASLYKDIGKYALAEPLYKEALEIYSTVLGKEHPRYALVCNNLGLLYKAMGQYKSSENLLIIAKNIDAKTAGTKHADYGTDCNNLASLYKEMGRYIFAEPLYKEYKEICRHNSGKQSLHYALACNNLGALYVEMNKYTSAESLYKESKDIYAQLVGKDHPDYALACSNLGLLYSDNQKDELAEPLLKEAKDIYEKTVGKTAPPYILACNNLGILYRYMKKPALAAPLYQEAAEAKLSEIKQNFISLTETQKEAYIQKNEFLFQSLYRFVVSQKKADPYLYDIVINTKGMIIGSVQAAKERILNHKDTAIKRLYLQWQDVNKKIVASNELTFAERRKNRINMDSLQKLAHRLDAQLNSQSADFNALNQENNITYKEIQQRLSPTEACVEIVRVNQFKDSCTYMALVLTKQNAPFLIVLPENGKSLENECLQNYRRAIKSKTMETDSYNSYWAPIANYLQKNQITKAYLSPDGVYNFINVNILYHEETKHHVIDEINLINVTNTKEIVKKTTSSKNLKKAVLLGRPDYQVQVKEEAKERGQGLSDLVGTEIEVNNIASLTQQKNITTQKITAQAATKDTVLHQVSPSILHIATHGFFNPNTELKTQTMLQSGLILAGAEVLSAFEAMQMDLRETELVCLSACETGLGTVKAGEGVYGLQRAFKVAGAKTVITSLWKVNDNATQALMSAFYTNWLQKNQDKQTAFKNAQLQIRETYKDAYFWGAFTLIGD